MGWLDWINIAGSVIDIASEVAKQIGDERDSVSAQAYSIGTVDWVQDSGKVYAVNADPANAVNLLYVTPNLNGASASTLSTAVTLPPNNGWSNETEHLQAFLGGTVTFNALPTAAANPSGRVYSFVMRTFSAATAISIIGGVNVSFTKTNTGWNFNCTTTGPKIDNVQVAVSDPQGNTATVQAKFSNTQLGASSATVALPQGIDLSTLVAEMQVDLTLASSALAELLEQSKHGRPADELPETLRARFGRA